MLLERRLVGPALQPAAAVDVEVREDPEEPGAEVRPRRVGLPAPERSRIRVLHQILCFLSGGDEPSCDPVDLVGERESLFLEAHPIACFGRDPARLVRLGRVRLAHAAYRINVVTGR